MSTDPNEIRYDIEVTRQELGADVDALSDKVNPSKIAGRQSDKLKHAVSSVKDRVMGSASDVGDAVADAPHEAVEKAKGNPMAVGLIAFGVGLLASSLIPASDPERRAANKVKEAAAPVTDELKDAAKDAADNLREPAKEAFEDVKQTATDAADTVKAEGTDAASDLKGDATDAKHAVQGDA